MQYSTLSTAALAAVAFAVTSSAHTWVEEMRIIAPNGTFTSDAPGYPRSFAKRLPGVNPDKAMVHILPADGTPIDVGITSNDVMCRPEQQKQVQSGDSPRLKAAPGDMVALRYQENGHVTLPEVNPAKPLNRGTVFVYGTTQPSDNEKFLEVRKWTQDGQGGNKKGKLLTTQNYDDGQCYQMNGGQISAARQKQFPHQADQLMGMDLWCQTDMVIPKDAPSGKPYTLYWAWDWSDRAGVDPALPKGKAQWYTSCMDIDVSGSKATGQESKAVVKIAQGQPIDQAAIASVVSNLAAGKAMLANPSQTAGSAPQGAVPASSAPAPASTPAAAGTPQSGVPQQSQTAPAAQAPAATAPGQQIVTVFKTITASAPQVESTSTSQVTVPKSTVDISASAAPNSAQGIPTISLKSLTGVASAAPSQATGAAGPYKMAKRGEHLAGHLKARPSKGSAKFRNL